MKISEIVVTGINTWAKLQRHGEFFMPAWNIHTENFNDHGGQKTMCAFFINLKAWYARYTEILIKLPEIGFNHILHGWHEMWIINRSSCKKKKKNIQTQAGSHPLIRHLDTIHQQDGAQNKQEHFAPHDSSTQADNRTSRIFRRPVCRDPRTQHPVTCNC